MRLFDAHCHLTDERISSDIDQIVIRAELAGVDKFLTMGGCRSDWDKLVQVANNQKYIYLAFGWHPEDLTKIEDLEDLKIIMSHPKALAIGETGLDFYWDKEKKTKQIQIEMLKRQIDLSNELKKPIIIHCRGAEEEMIEVIENTYKLRAHFHCFGESEKLLKKIISGGHMVSFGGNITFKSAQNLRDLLKIVPLEQLLLETDSPYLSPEPLRGRLNEPAHLRETAHFIAKELKIEVEELSQATYKNTICFFGLEN